MGDNAQKSKQKSIDPTVDFVAGTIAGIAGLAIAYPFDTVKVRFQSPQTSDKYRSTLHAFSTIVREERFRGLYKGITSPMLSCAPLNGLVFTSYRFFMRLQLKSADDEPTIAQIGLAGVGSGIVASLIACPIELIKIRQQNIIDRQPTARDVALDIFRRNGIRGLYRGLPATALRDVGYGVYFATYEATCRYFSRHPPPSSESPLDCSSDGKQHADHSSLLSEVESEAGALSWPVLLFAGALAGVNGWFTTFMFDVVKTRMQSVDRRPGSPELHAASRGGRSSHPYRTTLSTIVHSYRTEGMSVFFRGLSPTLIRAIPVNMATFGVFEGVVHLLS
ncbi:carnitine/acyl carnitine carrier [Phellopilus nigrolimitatus]|nr:carnitine/acyl carnitine carrier [Phellopilus nigrolimitatus]KAH8111703.1 carnitine/acyl carnitine carrier [Phellopilus nigrolimitatus]